MKYSTFKSFTITDWFAKIATWRTAVISLFIHFILVVLLGGTVLYQKGKEQEDFVAGLPIVSDNSELEKPAGAPNLAPELPSMPDVTAMTPPQASLSTIMSASPTVTAFQVPVTTLATSRMATQISASVTNGAQSVHSLVGSGPSGGGENGTGRAFFGVQMKANTRHVAILLDYSGSMEGPFRAKMEQELEKFLGGVSKNVEVLIIPWAGPAWMVSQLGPQISKKWRKIDSWDNFAVVEGQTLDPPVWTPINPENLTKILKDTHAQVAMSGGTDWRQPFRYAMSATPPPDMIFFMTDGQIRNTDSTFSDIRTSLAKSPKTTEVNCLWIVNKTYPATPLKALAKEYKGTFKEVGGKDSGEKEVVSKGTGTKAK